MLHANHVAKKKKVPCMSSSNKNKTDGGAQPILTQMGWYNHSDPVIGTTVREKQQQM